jgi:uncharacterized protein YeaO (DUF488 family)
MFWTSTVQKYTGECPFDITYKSNSIFSPTKKLVHDFKFGQLSEKEYTEQYYTLMRISYTNYRKQWEYILDSKNMFVFLCYCHPDNFCHRFLLKDILVKLGKEYMGEI